MMTSADDYDDVDDDEWDDDERERVRSRHVPTTAEAFARVLNLLARLTTEELKDVIAAFGTLSEENLHLRADLEAVEKSRGYWRDRAQRLEEHNRALRAAVERAQMEPVYAANDRKWQEWSDRVAAFKAAGGEAPTDDGHAATS